jgi:hypothetical protein
MFRPANKK